MQECRERRMRKSSHLSDCAGLATMACSTHRVFDPRCYRLSPKLNDRLHHRAAVRRRWVNDWRWPILLKNSGFPADVSESQKSRRGEVPQIVFRRLKSKATHSPHRCRLEKLLEFRRTEFFNKIGRFESLGLSQSRPRLSDIGRAFTGVTCAKFVSP